MNPNAVLFSRISPAKKLELVESFTQAQLLSISKASVMRIIKETGLGRRGSRDKILRISHDFRAGNHRNSDVESITIAKGIAYVDVYVQLDSTDTTDTVPYKVFFTTGEYRGTIPHSDRYGNTTHSYYRYDSDDKAEVIRSICREYIHRKYKEKPG